MTKDQIRFRRQLAKLTPHDREQILLLMKFLDMDYLKMTGAERTQAREFAGLSMEQAGKLLGCRHAIQLLYEWENNIKQPSRHRADLMNAIFDPVEAKRIAKERGKS